MQANKTNNLDKKKSRNNKLKKKFSTAYKTL